MTQAKTKNILAIIEAEHRQVEKLFAEIERAESNDKYNFFNQIYKALSLHTRTEEIVFYPAMREYQETKKYVEEAEEEHEEVNILLEEIKQLKPTDSEFKVKINELKQAVQHHVEEEESEIFSAVRKCIKEDQLANLGQEFLQVKSKVETDVETAMTM